MCEAIARIIHSCVYSVHTPSTHPGCGGPARRRLFDPHESCSRYTLFFHWGCIRRRGKNASTDTSEHHFAILHLYILSSSNLIGLPGLVGKRASKRNRSGGWATCSQKRPTYATVSQPVVSLFLPLQNDPYESCSCSTGSILFTGDAYGAAVLLNMARKTASTDTSEPHVLIRLTYSNCTSRN